MPHPRHVFLMMPSHKGQPEHLKPVVRMVEDLLERHRFTYTEGPSLVGLKDYLCSICYDIQASSFGVGFAARGIRAPTLGNIFWEKGLMEGFGKHVILLADRRRSVPSNFVRDFTVFYTEPDYEAKFEAMLTQTAELPEYYCEVVAREALDAGDVERAAKYLTDAYLISGDAKYEAELDSLITLLQTPTFDAGKLTSRLCHHLVAFKRGTHLGESRLHGSD